MKYITYIIQHINDNINKQNDKYICSILEEYLCTSYACYIKDKVIQPAFNRNIKVLFYKTYPDNTFAYNHKTNRLLVVLDDNTEVEISLYKFKRYARHIVKHKNFIL